MRRIWLDTAPDATEPIPVSFHGIVEVARPTGGEPYRMHARRWDLAAGPLIYLTRCDDMPPGHTWSYDDEALVAAALLPPRLWHKALILLDIGHTFKPGPLEGDPPFAFSLYRLTVRGESIDVGFTRRLRRTVCAGSARRRATANFIRVMPAVGVERILGRPVATWLRGTRLLEAVERAGSATTPIAVPDGITGWPRAAEQLITAHEIQMATEYPAAYALLAADTSTTLGEVRQAYARLPVAGPGWYLAAVPEPPDLPPVLESRLAEQPPLPDVRPDQVAADLTALRHREGDLPADAHNGDLLEHAVHLLTAAAEKTAPRLAADMVCVVRGTMLTGPITQQWRAALQRHPEPDRALRSRRGQRLLGAETPEQVDELLIDHAGRLVALLPSSTGGQDFHAEWPTGLPSQAWTDQTVIVGDHSEGNACGPLLALTPTRSGEQRIDPVPGLYPAGRTFDGFVWGYEGGGPGVLYDALLRVVLEEPLGLGDIDVPVDSRLWEAITASSEPLEMRWPDVWRWARQDHLGTEE